MRRSAWGRSGMARRLLAWGLTAAGVAGLVTLGLSRLTVDADVTSVLPRTDPLVNEVRRVYQEVPALERIYIDVSVASGDRVALRRAARRVQRALRRSGLVRSVGLPRAVDAVARLYARLPERLPLLFDAATLEREVAPRLESSWIARHLAEMRQRLLGLEGVGTAKLLAQDPLSLRDLVMARLGQLRPASQATLDGDLPVSGDGRHALVIAVPRRGGTDTTEARQIFALLGRVAERLGRMPPPERARLVAVGGARAALDNERTIRHDAERSLTLAVAGIFLLVLIAFPRPLLGMLSLVPAAVGAAVALAVYSLIRTRISALALGFGGALVSLTVDHGLVYLLFYANETGAAARRARAKLWSVGLLPAITTVAAFLLLPLAGFPLLTQVGLYAGLGVAASFLFSHWVLPWLVPPRLRPGRDYAHRVPRGLLRLGRMGWGAPAALVGVGLLGAAVARPRFALDVRRMNAVSRDTQRAEAHFRKVWGEPGQEVILLARAESGAATAARADALDRLLRRARAEGQIRGGFSPSELFPGPRLARENLAAWRAFWTPARRASLRQRLGRAAREVGFAPQAFSPFFAQISPGVRPPSAEPPPRALWPLLGLVERPGGKGILLVTPVRRGPRYNAAALDGQARAAGLRALDIDRFSARLSKLLASGFGLMLLLVGAGVVLMVSLLLLDASLILLALAPLGLAIAGTLGTLNLLGRPLDLAAIMLAIVVFGTGVDYGLYVVRSFQWDPAERPGVHGPVRTAVLLAGGSTWIGFFSLLLSDHPVLRSVGVTVTLGIGFSLLGALLLLPPVLRWRLRRPAAPRKASSPVSPGSRGHWRAVAACYHHLEPYPRLFAWFKLRLDPLFTALPEWLPGMGLVIDLGAGFGVPACFAATLHPGLRLVALEPDGARARVAAAALGALGGRRAVLRAAAPALPLVGGRAQAVLLLDVVHHLDDEALAATCAEALRLLVPGGRLVLRATVPGDGHVPLPRRLEGLRLWRLGRRPHYRDREAITRTLRAAGFDSVQVQAGPAGREETWFLATAQETMAELGPGAGAGAETGAGSAPGTGEVS